MKKLIFSLCLCLSTILVGCMNAKDMMPEDKTNETPVEPDPDDGGFRKNTDWFDTLRPPLNPNIVEYNEAALSYEKEGARAKNMERATEEVNTPYVLKNK